MPSLALTLVATPLNPSWTGNLNDFHIAVVNSITATVPDTSNLILGRVGGVAPTSDIGPWLDSGTWKYWNGSSYVTNIIKITGPVPPTAITLTGAPTVNRTVTFQDRDGTVALTSDVYTPRTTVTLGASPANIDWSQSGSFKDTISADKTYTVSNSLSGQSIFVAVYNSDVSGHTLTWPESVNMLVSGTSVTSTTVAAGKTDLYIFRNIGGAIYGQALQGY